MWKPIITKLFPLNNHKSPKRGCNQKRSLRLETLETRTMFYADPLALSIPDTPSLVGEPKPVGPTAEVFLQQQTGITKSALGGYIRSAKSDYTLSRHEQVRKTFVDKQRNELAATKTSHMTDSDLDDILRHTKTDKMFNRDLLNTQLGGIILDVYRSNGVFDYGTIDQIAQSTKGETDFNQYLTADAKKQKKDMVNNYAMSR